MSFAITRGGHIVPRTADDSVYRALVRTLGAWVRQGERRAVWELVAAAVYRRALVEVQESTDQEGRQVVTLTLGGPAVRP